MAPELGECQAGVYAAENDALSGLGIRWRRVAEAQAYADRLVGSAWFGERWPHFLHCAVQRRGSGSVWSLSHPFDASGPGGRPTEGLILLADGAAAQEVLLHELAHLLAPPDAGHGPGFVDVHLDLVRAEMGFFAFAGYRDALRARVPAAVAGAVSG